MRYTKNDYEDFVKYVNEFLNLFNIGGYEITYKFAPVDSETFAQVVFDVDSRRACFMLSDNELPDYEISSTRECAIHEVLHLLLAELQYHSKNREYVESIYDSEEHAVINRITAVLRKLRLL